MTVEVRLNGKPRQITEGATLLDLLRDLQVQPERVVVEQNRQILRYEDFAGAHIAAGDELELVYFVGGG
jgi:thiazole synthase